VRREFTQLLLLLCMVVWVPIFATLCMRAEFMLWYAFLFPGLRHVGFFFPSFSFSLVVSTPFLVRMLYKDNEYESGKFRLNAIGYNAQATLLHKLPNMHCVKHKLVKNTLPSHHVQHDDTRVPPNCRRAENQTVIRHPGWLDLSLKRMLSVECVGLSP
jgi:hypothetical protein